MRRATASFCVLSLGVALSGCFAVADLDRFKVATACEEGTAFRDFTFNGSALEPHLNHVFQVFVARVNPDGTRHLRAHARFAPTTDASLMFTMPKALGCGDHEVAYYADVNSNGMVDMAPQDHTWIDPLRSDEDTLNFVHNFNFTTKARMDAAIDSPVSDPMMLTLTGFLPVDAGATVVVRVFETNTGHYVGLFRGTAPDLAPFELPITFAGVFGDTSPHTIEVTLDRDRNFACNGGELQWTGEAALAVLTATVARPATPTVCP